MNSTQPVSVKASATASLHKLHKLQPTAGHYSLVSMLAVLRRSTRAEAVSQCVRELVDRNHPSPNLHIQLRPTCKRIKNRRRVGYACAKTCEELRVEVLAVVSPPLPPPLHPQHTDFIVTAVH